jgi:hypothetical protein
MPYRIRKVKCKDCDATKCYKVSSPETGRVYAKCSTRENAERQVRLLRAIDYGWQPGGRN